MKVPCFSCIDSAGLRHFEHAAGQNDHHDVEDPGDGDEEQDDGDDDGGGVLVVHPGHDAVDAPDDIQRGDGENDLDQQGHAVEAVDEFLHGGFSFDLVLVPVDGSIIRRRRPVVKKTRLEDHEARVRKEGREK